MTTTRKIRRVLRGIVTSDKMSDTITVRVERTYKHAKYGKYVRKHAKYHAHDGEGKAEVGDYVEIAAIRPMSKLKRWRLVSVITAGAEQTGAIAGSGAGREVEMGGAARTPDGAPEAGSDGEDAPEAGR